MKRIKSFEEPTEYNNDEFLMLVWVIKSDYYRELIKVNYEKYDLKFFIRNKDKSGNYFEYSVDEIVEILWDK